MNVQQLMQQAQKMHKQLQETQEKLKTEEFKGKAGGGTIEVLMDGTYKMKSIKIDPNIVDKNDIEMLEDLIVTAYNDCKNKIDSESKNNLGKITGNMNMDSALNSMLS